MGEDHIPPAMLAEGDQIMAGAADSLEEWITRFRVHAASHGDGATLCPFSEVAVRVLLERPRNLPEMFASAIAQLAKAREDRGR